MFYILYGTHILGDTAIYLCASHVRNLSLLKMVVNFPDVKTKISRHSLSLSIHSKRRCMSGFKAELICDAP